MTALFFRGSSCSLPFQNSLTSCREEARTFAYVFHPWRPRYRRGRLMDGSTSAPIPVPARHGVRGSEMVPKLEQNRQI